jgi:hypothetical protein
VNSIESQIHDVYYDFVCKHCREPQVLILSKLAYLKLNEELKGRILPPPTKLETVVNYNGFGIVVIPDYENITIQFGYNIIPGGDALSKINEV